MMKKTNVFTKTLALVLSVIMVVMTPLSYDLGFADMIKEVFASDVEYEYYDEVYNSNLTVNGTNMPTEWGMVNGAFVNFTPSAENTSGSFKWKFKYTCANATGNVYIYPLASAGWQGAQEINFKDCGFEVGNTYEVEIGVLKRKSSTIYDVYVSVDGVKKIEKTREIAHNNNCATNNCTDDKAHRGLYFYLANYATDFGSAAAGTCTEIVEYEYYDELKNSDLTVSGGTNTSGTMPAEWQMVNQSFVDFEPSAQNTTGSFVWAFDYTCADATSAVNIYPLASGAWRGTELFNLNDGKCGFEVGETYEVEFGVLKRKGSEANKYDVYVAVDGVKKIEKTMTRQHHASNCGSACTDLNAHTGMYFYLTGSGGSGTCVTPSLYETYDVLTNTDWKLDGNGVTMPNDWTISNETFIDFTPSAENTTGSFIWNFTYECINATDAVNIYPRAGGSWGGDGATLFDFNNLSTKFTAGESYEIELGVLKLKKEAGYYVYVEVDGALAYEKTITAGIEKGHGLFFYTTGDAARKGAGVCSSDEYKEYEYFDVLHNSDWTVDGTTMTDPWTMSGSHFITFTPTAKNTTGSFVWKYQYTHIANPTGEMAIYPFASRAWTGLDQYMRYQLYGFTVGETYDVEFGVLKRKDSAENVYHIFVKVDGEYTYGPTAWTRICKAGCGCGDVTKHIGLHVYSTTGGEGTCDQIVYTVNVDGNLYEVNPNETLGSALVTFKDAPAGYAYTGAWKDQNGNPFTKITPVTSNLVLTPVYEEVIEYEYYDVLKNSDFTVSGSSNGTMPTEWPMVNQSFVDFEPSAENTTGSFVWAFDYTCTDATNAVNIYPLASGAWRGTELLNLNDGKCGFEVGKTYEVEIGVLKRKGSEANKYDVYVSVNGVKKIETTMTRQHHSSNCGTVCTDLDAHTGMYFYLTGSGAAGTCVEPALYETYDVLNNADWKLNGNGVTMPNDWTISNETYIDFEPSAENTTGSFIWKFTYDCINATDAVNIYPRAGGDWGGDGTTVFDFNNLVHKFTAGDSYEVELGVLKLIKEEAYYVYVKVDGELWYERTITAGITNGHGLFFYTTGDAVRTGAGVCSYDDGYDAYETFDILHNSDWTVYNGSNVSQGTMGVEWDMVNDKFLNFTPSADNTTGSFVWKYQYKHTQDTTGQMVIYPFSSKPWGSTKLFDYKNCNFTVGQTYDVEFGILKYKDSANYHVYVKVDGEYTNINTTMTRECTNCDCGDATKHTGLYLYYTAGDGAGTSTQTAYNVNIDGKMYEVDVNGTLGSALVAFNGPKGYTLAGWKDQNGAAFAKTTPVTSNLTLTPVYTSDYTVVDEAGATLTSGTHTYGSSVAYDASGLTTGTQTLIGYEVGDKLYKDLTSSVIACAETKSSVVAKTITLGSLDGASIRLGSQMSIRFTATINQADSEYAAIKNFGIVIATDTVRNKLTDFTIENLDAAGANYGNVHSDQDGFKYGLRDEAPNQYFYSVVFDTLSIANSATDYAARAYVQVEYADGSTGYVYSAFNPNEHVRSMYEVACAAIQDTTEGYSSNDKAAMQKYIDAVVDLNSSLALQGPARNYTATVSEPSGGYYTITINPTNGFDIKNLGCVIVNGQRMKIYNANLSAKTFQIKENDTAEAAANTIFGMLDNVDASRDLLVNAYIGPQLGVKIEGTNTAPQLTNGGHTLTLEELETYMNAGFNAWRIETGVESDVIANTAAGTTYQGDKNTYDIYLALDIAAQYAKKYNKPCPVYINITNLTDRNNSEAGLQAIKTCYDIFTNYDDGITGTDAPSTIAGKKNQIAGFLLRDEPYLEDYDRFEDTYNYIAYDLGAIVAGYDFSYALLSSHAGSQYTGDSYEEYIRKYATLLKDTTLTYDNYPFNYQKKDPLFGSTTETWSLGTDWFSNMELIRAYDHGYGTCIQSYTAGPTESGTWNTTTKYKQIKSESEISMQVYTALAYGFTNLDYFTYMEPNNYKMQENSGVLAEVFQNTPVQWNDYNDWSKGYTTTEMYNWIQNTNTEATKLYDVLGKFTSQGVQLVKGSTATNNYFGSATNTNTTNAITVSSTYDMVVGGFKCGDLNGYLAVNVDFPNNGDRTTTATFTLGTGYTSALVYVNGVATLKTVTNGQLTMDIGAGEGAFIVPFN